MSLKIVLLFALVFVACVSAQEAEVMPSRQPAPPAPPAPPAGQAPGLQIPLPELQSGLNNLLQMIGLNTIMSSLTNGLGPMMGTLTGGLMGGNGGLPAGLGGLMGGNGGLMGGNGGAPGNAGPGANANTNYKK